MQIRVIGPVIVIGLAAAAAGCGGSSSVQLASVQSGARPTTAATQPAASRSQTAAAKLAAKTTPRGGRTATVTTVAVRPRQKATVPRHLVGKRLDIAERMLRTARVRYTVIALHGRVSKRTTAQWGVCETMPAAKSSGFSPAVDLLVARHRCGGR